MQINLALNYGFKDELINAKQNVVCTLIKQPLENNMILAGIFNEDGDILDVFESK